MGRPIPRVLFEALLVGIAAWLTSHILDLTLPLMPQRSVVVMIATGAALHLALELAGGNETWCRASFP